MSGKKLEGFLFLTIFLFNIFSTRAQISEELYKILPLEIKPFDRSKLTLEEKRKIVDRAHDFSWNAEASVVKEIRVLVEELKRFTQRSSDTTVIVLNNAALGNYFYELTDENSNPWECVLYFNKVISYGALNPRYGKQLAYAYLGIGMFGILKNKYEEASEKFNKAVEIFTSLKDTTGLSVAHSCLYPLYSAMNLYHKAIEEQNITLTYTTAKEKQNGVGLFYKVENFQDKALTYLSWYEDCGDKRLLDSALFYIKSMDQSSLKADQWNSFQLFLKGYYSYLTGDYNKAVILIDSSLHTREYYSEITPNKLAYKGISLLKSGKRAAAYKILLSPGLTNKDHNLAYMVFEALHKDALAQNDFRKAVEYLTLAYAYKDSAALLTQRGQVFEAMQKYALMSKEKEIQALELGNAKENEKRSKLIFAFAAIVVTMVAVIISLYARGRERKYKALEAQALLDKEKRNKEDMLLLQEREIQRERKRAILYLRKKISRDMHDELSSALSGLKYYINDLRLKESNEESRRLLESIEQEVASVYSQARTYMHNLHKGIEDVVGSLNPFLQQISTSLSQRKNLNIELKYDKKEIESKLSSTQQNQLTLMLKEATSNILKHSGASKIEVNISFPDNSCYFYIRDNGRGFEQDTRYEGLGMESMLQRMNRIKGRMVINSSVAGTKLEGIFPLV